MNGGRYEVQGPPSWSAESGKDKFIFSWGSVWRKEPALAKTQLQALEPQFNLHKAVLAATKGNVAEVRKLLNQGVDAQIVWSKVLGIVVIRDYVDVAKLLIAKGADVNKTDNSGDTALHVAAKCMHGGVVKVLVAAGANTNAKDNDGQTPLHIAASRGDVGVVKALIAEGANINAKDNENKTPLQLAKENGHDEIVKILQSS